MSKLSQLFDFVAVDNKAERTLFLLHGTGGSKEDFLFLNDELKNKYNLVGLQGNIDEDGMGRFFRRYAPGVFDKENIKEEATKFNIFVSQWMVSHNFSAEQLFFLGYSNGANMLLASLFYYPELMRNLILLHSMLPIDIKPGSLNLKQHKIFISNGIVDPIISRIERFEVIQTLQSCGAQLSTKEYQSGHEISNQEIRDVVLLLQI